MTATLATESPFDVGEASYGRRPFPHIRSEAFLDADLYAQLRSSFPQCPPSTGPTGTSLYWGDPEYDRLVTEHPAWRTLFTSVQSQSFVDACLERFRSVIESDECLLDLSQARFVSYRESREDKELRHLSRIEHAPHELWVRMDIHQGHVGYERHIHCDHKRRVLSMLVYFCDAAEDRMQGGELLLHPPKHRFWPAKVQAIAPRHNRMVAFACSKNSRHSVPVIESLAAPRNFVQIAISSSVDAWR